jgi:NAD(P)-dependent dehydrogenase (short-subunit alcohol dehydrogenase family)
LNARFENKNILIIGASTGIGHEIARQILEEGGTVYVAGQHKPDLDVQFFEWNALAPDESAFNNLPDTLHGIIYCAGTINLKPFGRLTLENFTTDFQMNTLGERRGRGLFQHRGREHGLHFPYLHCDGKRRFAGFGDCFGGRICPCGYPLQRCGALADGHTTG